MFQRFAQQDLAGWSPILTPGALVLYFVLAGAVCAAIGAPLLAASLSVVQVRVRYDDAGALAGLDAPARAAALAAAGGGGVPLTLSIPIARPMRAPVYVYYELGAFYQNHKRYVRSRDDQQMGGVPGPPAERCAPEKTTADGEPIVPCGLAAWSHFNDTFADWALVEPGGGGHPAHRHPAGRRLVRHRLALRRAPPVRPGHPPELQHRPGEPGRGRRLGPRPAPE